MGTMNVTLTLPDDLVKKCRKIAAERETTLTGMIREYLQELVTSAGPSEEQKRQLAAMEEAFRTVSFRSDGRKWTREELNERPTKYGAELEAKRKRKTS